MSEGLETDSPVQCAHSHNIADQVATVGASGENYIVPVPIEERSKGANDLMIYPAPIVFHDICEKSDALTQTVQVVNDIIEQLKRICENATNPPSHPGQANANDEVGATLRKEIMESAKQIYFINEEMKKLGDMLKQWVPTLSDNKRGDATAMLEALTKKSEEVEHDLKDRVFVKDAQIKQLQDDFKEQIHAKDEQIRAKDEQIKQMQEHQKETYKTNSAELTWRHEVDRLQAELNSKIRHHEEEERKQTAKVDELQKELSAKEVVLKEHEFNISWMIEIMKEQSNKEEDLKTKVEKLKNELKEKENTIGWMDVKIKEHEEHEKCHTEDIEHVRKARGDEIEQLKNLLKAAEEKLETKKIELEDLQKLLSKDVDKIHELEKSFENSSEFQLTIQSQTEELKNKNDEIKYLQTERNHLQEKLDLLKENRTTVDKCLDKIPDASKQQPMASSHISSVTTVIRTSSTSTAVNVPEQMTTTTDALVKRDKLIKTDSSSSSE